MSVSKFKELLPKYNPGSARYLPRDIVERAALELGLSLESTPAVVAAAIKGLNPFCKACGKQCHLISFNQGFREYCSATCSNGSDSVKKKKEQTSIDRYGSPYHFQSEQSKKRIKSKLQGRITGRIEDAVKLIEDQGFDVEPEVDFSSVWRFKCHDCTYEFWRIPPTWNRWPDWKTVCPKCSHGSSHPEKKVAMFLEELGVSITRRDRSVIGPKELDIYIPDKQLAIEINGLYWHSEDPKRHLEKLETCLTKGIRLIQIEDLLLDKSEAVVYSRLRAAVGTVERIYARNCELVELDKSEASEFLNNNHLSASVVGVSLAIGLSYQGKLVHVMTFGKNRFSKEAEYELLRSASIINTVVVGAVSRCIKHVLKMVPSFLTYADRNWGEGYSYQKAGGTFLRNTAPGYFWWKGSQVLSRYQTQKKNLPDLLEHFDANLTESENMHRHGWCRYWNCGNAVYLFQS